jgi:hypothetical protein
VLCQTNLSRDCPTSDRCYLEGCLQPYGPPPGTTVARERQPIDLPQLRDYAPGPLARVLQRAVDAVRRDPTPAPVDPEAILQALERPPMSETVLPPAPPPPSGRTVVEIRARRIGSGWLLYANGQEVDVGHDASIGALIADLVQR